MAKKDEERIFAFLCYLISIIGVIIVLATKRERSKFSIYHARQGLMFFITWIVIWIIIWILSFVPVLGVVVAIIGWIFIVVLWIMGIVYSLTGQKKPLPLIGKYAKAFKF